MPDTTRQPPIVVPVRKALTHLPTDTPAPPPPATTPQIPEINAVGVEGVRPNQLVRFRAMVQDMYNPEYYVGAYRDATTAVRPFRCWVPATSSDAL